MRYIIICLALAFLLTNAKCGKPCKEATYQFFMDEKFYPEKDSISVGDTLFLSCSHSTNLKDTLSNSIIDFSNSQIGGSLRILQLPKNSSTVVGGVNDFDIFSLHGIPAGNDNIPKENKSFYFEEINNTYILQLGFITKQKGVYVISLGNSIGIVQRKGSCEKANIEIANANMNNHLYFYQDFFPGLPISDYTKTHIYCFEVF